MITHAQLTALVGDSLAARWHPAVVEMLAAADASTPLRAAHMLAQILHETAGLRLVEENMNYSAEGLLKTWPSRFTPELAQSLARKPSAIANHVYGDRMGNFQPGDGWKFRGRGFIQLTGRANYTAYHKAGGADVVSNPDLAMQPPHAGLAAAWYWAGRGINAAADRDDLQLVTRAVNGGLNGLADRQKWLNAAKLVLTEQTENIGTFEVLVLHNITPDVALALAESLADGELRIVLTGQHLTASKTGGRKLDVRFVS